jgi:hypothetical protein
MRSIPLALGWELLRRGRWGLILAVLAANGLPVLIFTALRREGALDPTEQYAVIMNVLLIELNLFLFGTATIGALAPMARLYTFPVSTSSLVGWNLLLGMFAVAIEMVASLATVNALFHLGWPLWGPALFAAAAFAALQPVIWLGEKSAWLAVIFGVVAIPLCLWFHSRQGSPFQQPSHYWVNVTAGDVLTLCLVAVGGYFLGIYGVTRNRCGMPPYSVGLLAWLGRVFAFGPETGLKFRSPIQAQLWFEWRK